MGFFGISLATSNIVDKPGSHSFLKTLSENSVRMEFGIGEKCRNTYGLLTLKKHCEK